MSPLLVKICKDFATIWTTIDPIGNVAIFAGLTASLTRAERRRTALQMLFGRLDSNPGSPEPGRDLAVFPLAVPSIAGPGAMMAVILLTDNDVYTVPQQAETGVVLLVVLLVTYIFLRFSDIILRVIGQQGAAVLVRVMGIILASLAVAIVLTALTVGSCGPAKALSQ